MAAMPRLYLWSASRLRNGVEDWKEITPEPLRRAVEALRRKFAECAWKVGEIMRQGCHPALHCGMADQAKTISDGIKTLGYPVLPTVDEGETEPEVFTAYFDRCTGLLAKEVQRTFSDLFDIASAQSALLNSDPVDWAALQTKVVVADESHMIPIWTKNACDIQPHDPSDTSDESIYWNKWRAPRWFFMKPFANPAYDRSTAWERMTETDSVLLLQEVEDRFNHRLIMALDNAVDETHVRLAKQVLQSTPATTRCLTKTTPRVQEESAKKGGQLNGPSSNSQPNVKPTGMASWRRGPDPPVIKDLVSFTLPGGSTDADVVLKIAESLGLRVEGIPDAFRDAPLPRGKVAFGSAAHILDQITARCANLYWAVADGVLRFAMRESQAELEVEKADSDLQQGKKHRNAEFTHSDDYRNVNIRNESYDLTPRQAQMIQILYEAHTGGVQNVAVDNILERLGTSNSRWQDTWRSSVNARKALVRNGDRKGTLRLNI